VKNWWLYSLIFCGCTISVITCYYFISLNKAINHLAVTDELTLRPPPPPFHLVPPSPPPSFIPKLPSRFVEIQINAVPRPLNIGGFYPYVVWVNGKQKNLKPGEVQILAKALNLPLDSPPNDPELHSGKGWLRPLQIPRLNIKDYNVGTSVTKKPAKK